MHVVATHINRGILKMLRGDAASAAQDYDAALQLDPRQPEAWLNKAVMVLNGGDSRNASQLAQRALELQTKKPAVAMYIQEPWPKRGIRQHQRCLCGIYQSGSAGTRMEATKEELKRYRVTGR